MKLALVDFPVSCNWKLHFSTRYSLGYIHILYCWCPAKLPHATSCCFSLLWQNEDLGLDAEKPGQHSISRRSEQLLLSVAATIRSSEGRGDKAKQKPKRNPNRISLGFCNQTFNIGWIIWKTDHSRLDFVAVLCLSFQKTGNSVGVMLKDPIMRDKWSE